MAATQVWRFFVIFHFYCNGNLKNDPDCSLLSPAADESGRIKPIFPPSFRFCLFSSICQTVPKGFTDSSRQAVQSSQRKGLNISFQDHQYP